jgi:hypothetical protein
VSHTCHDTRTEKASTLAHRCPRGARRPHDVVADCASTSGPSRTTRSTPPRPQHCSLCARMRCPSVLGRCLPSSPSASSSCSYCQGATAACRRARSAASDLLPSPVPHHASAPRRPREPATSARTRGSAAVLSTMAGMSQLLAARKPAPHSPAWPHLTIAHAGHDGEINCPRGLYVVSARGPSVGQGTSWRRRRRKGTGPGYVAAPTVTCLTRPNGPLRANGWNKGNEKACITSPTFTKVHQLSRKSIFRLNSKTRQNVSLNF